MKLDEKFKWLGKAYNKTATGFGADVSVSQHLYKKGKDPRTVITFRNSCYAKVTKNMHLVFLPVGTRLYMREASPTEGFKLTSFSKDNSSCHTYTLSKVLPVEVIEVGNYDLEYDKECGYYYIDIAHKKER